MSIYKEAICVGAVGTVVSMTGVDSIIGEIAESSLSGIIPIEGLVDALTFGAVVGGIYALYSIFLKDKMNKM